MSSEHRAWFETLRPAVANRPCLVVGSAPDPTFPQDPGGASILCVNCAGFSAAQHGLAPPDITFLRTKKLVSSRKLLDREALRGLSTRHLVLVRSADEGGGPESYTGTLARLDYRYETIAVISTRERVAFIAEVIGQRFGLGGRDETKISSGLSAVCLAFALGASQVVLCGISLESEGLSYVDHPCPRHHKKPDAEGIACMLGKGLPLRTCEPGLASTTGLPLAR